MPDVIVIGAGITGLTCAYRLEKLGFDTVVLESSDRIGGVIRTQCIEEHVVEWGPSSMLPTPHTFELLEELGLAEKLIQGDPKSPRYIVVNGTMKKLPFGPLSFGGIARMMAEPFIRSTSTNDESIANFVRRRLGKEAHDRLAAPALSGIY